jgi:16S rRNA (adenine1518-N6/adenine1519-N6)-dimethyltransferase
MTNRDPDRLRRRAGVRGDPSRDQHFLVDDRVLDRIPSYLPDQLTTERLLEIGAGTGALTDRLFAVEGVKSVTAIERDTALAEFLRQEFADEVTGGRLTVIEGDALAVELPAYDACVSNLPYGISGEVTFRLLRRRRPAVCTYQAEFADRLVAEPGTDDYGRLSVAARHYAETTVVERVPPTAFDPQPAVESAVVRLAPREPTYEVPDDGAFLNLVKAIFTQRRKTVRNAIHNTTHISGIDDPDAVVAAASEATLGARAGDLSPERYATLARLAAEVDGSA